MTKTCGMPMNMVTSLSLLILPVEWVQNNKGGDRQKTPCFALLRLIANGLRAEAHKLREERKKSLRRRGPWFYLSIPKAL